MLITLPPPLPPFVPGYVLVEAVAAVDEVCWVASFFGQDACFSRSYCISRFPREPERVSVRSVAKISLVASAFSGEPRVFMRKFSFATTSFFCGMNTFSLRCFWMQLALLDPSV